MISLAELITNSQSLEHSSIWTERMTAVARDGLKPLNKYCSASPSAHFPSISIRLQSIRWVKNLKKTNVRLAVEYDKEHNQAFVLKEPFFLTQSCFFSNLVSFAPSLSA